MSFAQQALIIADVKVHVSIKLSWEEEKRKPLFSLPARAYTKFRGIMYKSSARFLY